MGTVTTVPTPPTSFTFRCLQQNQLTWTITNTSGAPVTGLTVNATLYANRSRVNPTTQPGTVADSNFNNLALAETPALSGIYIGTVPNAFNPTPATSGFVTIINALNGATLVNTWTIPSVVVFPQNNIDLCQLDDVKNWLSIASTDTDNDFILQWLITSFSQYVLNRTGQSSFNSVNTYTEIYDGNNATRLFLRNYPIISVSSVLVGMFSVPQSSGLTTSGWYIDPHGKSIALRWNTSAYPSPPYSIWPGCFLRGQGNIQVTYTAGYTSVPYDLQEAAIEAVAQNYVRKAWVDLASRQLGTGGSGAGTVRYRDWFIPPGVEYILQYYTRRAVV